MTDLLSLPCGLSPIVSRMTNLLSSAFCHRYASRSTTCYPTPRFIIDMQFAFRSASFRRLASQLTIRFPLRILSSICVSVDNSLSAPRFFADMRLNRQLAIRLCVLSLICVSVDNSLSSSTFCCRYASRATTRFPPPRLVADMRLG